MTAISKRIEVTTINHRGVPDTPEIERVTLLTPTCIKTTPMRGLDFYWYTDGDLLNDWRTFATYKGSEQIMIKERDYQRMLKAYQK